MAAWTIGQSRSAADHPAVAYATSTPVDAIARLQKRLATGADTPSFDATHGYLPWLLDVLDVPRSSQGLVFSRTSLQVDRIAPWRPRALYFSDEVYVGWVQEGPIIEIASVDPNLGTVFYSLRQTREGLPEFQRETTTCLMCHDSASVTGGVPGLIMRSMFVDRYGYAITGMGAGVTSDRSPLEERWGGWYVTGKAARAHAGNVLSPRLSHEVGNVQRHLQTVDLRAGSNLTTLADRFDTSAYLTPHSDIVALMILAHQTNVHNLITRLQYDGRQGRAGAQDVEALVRALFFVKEAPLGGRMEGTSGFAQDFAARGPRDGEGRSLRDLDLQTRLFRHPLSYLIYSEQFAALPDALRTQIYLRLDQILRAAESPAGYEHLSAGDRQAIRQILHATKPDFAAAVAR